jgi:hypothetical protein
MFSKLKINKYNNPKNRTAKIVGKVDICKWFCYRGLSPMELVVFNRLNHPVNEEVSLITMVFNERRT